MAKSEYAVLIRSPQSNLASTSIMHVRNCILGYMRLVNEMYLLGESITYTNVRRITQMHSQVMHDYG